MKSIEKINRVLMGVYTPLKSSITINLLTSVHCDDIRPRPGEWAAYQLVEDSGFELLQERLTRNGIQHSSSFVMDNWRPSEVREKHTAMVDGNSWS